MMPADAGERIANATAAVRRLLKREHKRNQAQDLGVLLVVCEATEAINDVERRPVIATLFMEIEDPIDEAIAVQLEAMN